MGKRSDIAPKTPKASKKAKKSAKTEDGQDDSIQFLGESGPAPPAPAPSAGMTVTRQGKPNVFCILVFNNLCFRFRRLV